MNETSKFSELRELFIRRMTEDSETKDARRKDFNQAIFGVRPDGSTYQCFNGTDMQMVLQCFDDAVQDLVNAPRAGCESRHAYARGLTGGRGYAGTGH